MKQMEHALFSYVARALVIFRSYSRGISERLSVTLITLAMTLVYTSFLVPQSSHAAAVNEIYVSNLVDNNVSVIDAATGDTITTISLSPTGSSPRAVVARGNRVYVANYSSQTISVIDTVSNTVIASIYLGTGGPERLTISQDGTRLYASDLGNNVYVIDTAKETVIHTLSGFVHSQGMTVNASGTRLYVVDNNCCSAEDGWLDVFDTSDYSKIATITVGIEPTQVALTSDGTKAYVTNDGGVSLGTTVSVIDTSTNTVANTVHVGVNPYAVAINSSGTRAYVMNTYYWAGGNTNSVTGTVSVVDTSTDSVVATIAVGYVPNYLTVSLDDSKVYVTNGNNNTVSVIDATSNTVVGSFNTGNDPWGIAQVSLIVKATPIITWPTPSDITYGTSLGSGQLDATAADPTTSQSLAGSFSYTLADGTTPAAGAVLPAGTGQILKVAFTPNDSADYTTATGSTTINVRYAPPGTSCDGDAGHAILQPINADGSSVFKQGRTVPARFRVCDANGVSIGTAGVVTSFLLVQTSSDPSATVNEQVSSTTPDTAFRWDATAQQWIFNISTTTLTSGTKYYYEISLNDGTTIDFSFALK